MFAVQPQKRHSAGSSDGGESAGKRPQLVTRPLLKTPPPLPQVPTVQTIHLFVQCHKQYFYSSSKSISNGYVAVMCSGRLCGHVTWPTPKRFQNRFKAAPNRASLQL